MGRSRDYTLKKLNQWGLLPLSIISNIVGNNIREIVALGFPLEDGMLLVPA
jgi:hypothetical protein